MRALPTRGSWAASNAWHPTIGRGTRCTPRCACATLGWSSGTWRLAIAGPGATCSLVMAAAGAALPSRGSCSRTPWRRLLGALCWPQASARRARRLDSARAGVPWTWDCARGLGPPPAAPHRALPAMPRCGPQGTVGHAPALERRLVERDPTLLPHCFDIPRAAGRRYRPVHAQAYALGWDMGPLEADRPRLAPS
jgi:hypothetical protein